jgi:ketosteroid isomerase-like protein
MKNISILVTSEFFLITLVLLSSCKQKVDLEAEKAAIQKTAMEHAEATSKGGTEGAEGYASYATSDALWLPNQRPSIKGRDAIKKMVLPATELKDYQITWDHPHVVVAGSGDIAYSVGTYSGGGKDTDGNFIEAKGKLVNIWHKQTDGSWKVAVAIWNKNEPCPISETNLIEETEE